MVLELFLCSQGFEILFLLPSPCPLPPEERIKKNAKFKKLNQWHLNPTFYSSWITEPHVPQAPKVTIRSFFDFHERTVFSKKCP